MHQSLFSLFAPGRIARPPFFIALTTHRDLMRDLIKDTPLEKVSRKKKKKKHQARFEPTTSRLRGG